MQLDLDYVKKYFVPCMTAPWVLNAQFAYRNWFNWFEETVLNFKIAEV